MCNQIYLRFHICPCELRYRLDECEYGRLDPRCHTVSMSIKWTHRDYCHYHMSVRAASRAHAAARAAKHSGSRSRKPGVYLPPAHQLPSSHSAAPRPQPPAPLNVASPISLSDTDDDSVCGAKKKNEKEKGEKQEAPKLDVGCSSGYSVGLDRIFNPGYRVFTGLPWTEAGRHFQREKPSSWWWRDYRNEEGRPTVMARPLRTAAAADPERFPLAEDSRGFCY
ncbi:hypothetical protein F4810DRAFT_715674 [Camillea tinctor]|nr:hypothetical protein F4810DRAFT_715674 [Camillea tinctor]